MSFTTLPYEYQPVMITLPESCLVQVRAALDSGLEAAEECHCEAVRLYAERRPLRVQWYVDQVAKIKEALWQLRQQAPSVFPAQSEGKP